MKYSRLIYKKKIRLLGVMLFLVAFSVDISYRIIRSVIKNSYKFTIWFIRYIKFIKAGYSYSDVHDLILSMDGRTFEIFIAELFKAQGYKTELTPQSNDYGRDVILHTSEGDIFIECKHYTGDNMVGREICSKLLGSVQMFKAIKGIVVTTGKFHENAYECAEMVDNLELWDMSDIMKLVAKVNQDKLSKILYKSIGSNSKIIKLQPNY